MIFLVTYYYLCCTLGFFQELLACITNENELDKNLACLEYCNIIMTFFYYVTCYFLKSLSIICQKRFLSKFGNLVTINISNVCFNATTLVGHDWQIWFESCMSFFEIFCTPCFNLNCTKYFFAHSFCNIPPISSSTTSVLHICKLVPCWRTWLYHHN